jgi:hypothetical protein
LRSKLASIITWLWGRRREAQLKTPRQQPAASRAGFSPQRQGRTRYTCPLGRKRRPSGICRLHRQPRSQSRFWPVLAVNALSSSQSSRLTTDEALLFSLFANWFCLADYWLIFVGMLLIDANLRASGHQQVASASTSVVESFHVHLEDNGVLFPFLAYVVLPLRL